MADLLEKACAWLGGMQSAHLSHPVTYCRANNSVQVAATVGKTTFDIDDGYGVVERWESRDFLIAAADLVLDGIAVLPAAGDRIREVQDGRTFVYEVLAPGKEPCWRYSDPYRMTLRIHTKQVE
jgi:hypothetical protein